MKRVILTAVFALLASNLFAAEALTENKRESWLNSFLSGGGMGAEPFAADPVACSSNWTRREYYNTATNTSYVCDGTAWRKVLLQGSTGTANSITAADIATDAVATAEILDGTIVNADVSASAAIARSKLAEDALQVYGIPISQLQQTTGIPLVASETAGNFDVTVATNVIKANGEVTDNETEVSVVQFQFVLPPEYVAAGDVSIRLRTALIATGSPTNNGSTIDVAVYEQTDGAVGSDLSTTTAAQTYAALDTWETDTFVITATDLVAGDIINVVITASVIDSEAGGGTIILNMDPPKVLLDVKG